MAGRGGGGAAVAAPDVNVADFAPAYRARLAEQLEPVRALLEERKADVCAKVEEAERKIQHQSFIALSSLPPALRAMTVAEYNAQYECNLLELLEKVLAAFVSGEIDEMDFDYNDDDCPSTIVRGTAILQAAGAGGARSLRGNPAATSSSHLSEHTNMFQTPTVPRDVRSKGYFWSTNAKKRYVCS
jgi:hypothetical protein